MYEKSSHLIRIDDFPHGDKYLFFYRDQDYREKVKSVLSIFELYEIPYILGVSPFLLQDGDIEFLNNLIKCGFVCMHGFNHGWDYEPWSNIVSTWKNGGEFAGLPEHIIEERYDLCDQILLKIDRYNREHFIPPFNCFTQELLNVLDKKGIKFIHTCDKEAFLYSQHKMHFGSMKLVVSEYGKTYADCKIVIKNFDRFNSQITLHWCYDINDANYIHYYHELCKKLLSKNK